MARKAGTAKRPRAASANGDATPAAAGMLPVEQLRPNDYNPNRMTDEEFAELVAEVRHLGRLPKPVVVRPARDGYVIVDGEHGWRAAKEAGLAEVPCEVIEADDFEAMRQTYKRNQHGTHEPVTLGRMFRRMMQDRNLSGRALAEEISVSEGSVRNAVMYAEAHDLRNSYAPDKADQVGKLSVRQVRCYTKLPPRVANLWLDSGGDLKTLMRTKDEDTAKQTADGFLDHAVAEYRKLEETGLFEFVGRVSSAGGFAEAVQKVRGWDHLEGKWVRCGIARAALRGYTRHHFKGAWAVRTDHFMHGAIGVLLNQEVDPPSFLLSPEEFAEVLELGRYEKAGRVWAEGYGDFMSRLELAVSGKTGQPPAHSRGAVHRELLKKQLEGAPKYIRDSGLGDESKYALWRVEAPEEAKQEIAKLSRLPLKGGEDDGTDNGLAECVRRLAREWKWRSEERQRVGALLEASEQQIAEQIASWFPIYDKQKDADAIAALAGKLATWTKPELAFFYEYAREMEHMKSLARAINAMHHAVGG
jgi:ParB/RepB/Spo0J family partition protein